MPRVLHVPDVFVQSCLCRYYLAAVDDRSATHRQDEVDAVFAHQLRSFLHLVVGGIGHNAAEVHHVLAALVQPFHRRVIQPRAFQRAAAVGQQHILAHTGHFFLDCTLCAPLAEVLSDGVLISELVHNFQSLLIRAQS